MTESSHPADRLSFLLGDHRGRQIQAASAWTAGGAAVTHSRAATELDGAVVIHVHEGRRDDDGTTFRVVNVVTRDPDDRDVLLLYAFDSAGFAPEPPARGRWRDGQLVLDRATVRGESRTVFRPTAEGYRWSKQFRPSADQPWQDAFDDVLQRSADPDALPVADTRPDDVAWPAMQWPPATGTRLRGDLVELVIANPDADAEALFHALDDDRVWKHVAGRPCDVTAQADRLAGALARGQLPWLVRLVRDHAGFAAGTVVGTSSYLDVSVADARLEIGSTAYCPAVWGTGVNAEAKLLLLDYAFDQLHAGRVQLKTDVRNVRSQLAIGRLGARYEGTLHRYQRRADGTVRDTVLFAILAEDWPQVRAGLRRRLR